MLLNNDLCFTLYILHLIYLTNAFWPLKIVYQLHNLILNKTKFVKQSNTIKIINVQMFCFLCSTFCATSSSCRRTRLATNFFTTTERRNSSQFSPGASNNKTNPKLPFLTPLAPLDVSVTCLQLSRVVSLSRSEGTKPSNVLRKILQPARTARLPRQRS